jgi:hypothetical protein
MPRCANRSIAYPHDEHGSATDRAPRLRPQA